jgi:hypothetical protein
VHEINEQVDIPTEKYLYRLFGHFSYLSDYIATQQIACVRWHLCLMSPSLLLHRLKTNASLIGPCCSNLVSKDFP